MTRYQRLNETDSISTLPSSSSPSIPSSPSISSIPSIPSISTMPAMAMTMASVASAEATAVNLLNLTNVTDGIDDNEDNINDDEESIMSCSWNDSYHHSKPAKTKATVIATAATTTTIERNLSSRGEALNLFDELNNCNGIPFEQVDQEDQITMEIPLLGPGHGKTNYQANYNNNYSSAPSSYQCRCDQAGFGANLVTKSSQDAKFKILLAISLCCIFMFIEFIGGYIAGSLAIMTDAAHLASDCISFIIGLVAIWLGSKPPDSKMSFGYKRMEVLGAIISVMGIWILTATLVVVAIQRVITNDYDLDSKAMMIISGIGIAINIIMVFVLHGEALPGMPAHHHGHSHSHSQSHCQGHSHTHLTCASNPMKANETPNIKHNSFLKPNHIHDLTSPEDTNMLLLSDGRDGNSLPIVGRRTSTSTSSSSSLNGLKGANGDLSIGEKISLREKNLNLRAAMIHVIGDLVQSIGVFLASILIHFFPKAQIADPLCTLLFSIIVIMTTVQLFKESIGILMDSVPKGFPLDDFQLDLQYINGVKSVHHLNVWNHTSNHSILMVHLVIDFLADSNKILDEATKLASGPKYRIKHSTIQIERLNP